MKYFFVNHKGYRLNIIEMKNDGIHAKRVMLTRDAGIPLVLTAQQVHDLRITGEFADDEGAKHKAFLPSFVDAEDLIAEEIS